MSQDVNPFRARNLPVTYLICCTYLVRVFRIKKKWPLESNLIKKNVTFLCIIHIPYLI
jgi:hypothetical protein